MLFSAGMLIESIWDQKLQLQDECYKSIFKFLQSLFSQLCPNTKFPYLKAWINKTDDNSLLQLWQEKSITNLLWNIQTLLNKVLYVDKQLLFMNSRDVFIGSAIVGIFSYILSAVLIPFLLQGDNNFNNVVKNTVKTFPIIPVTIGLVIFLVYFSYYSLVDIPLSTWEFSEKCGKFDEPEHRNEATSKGFD